MQRQLRELSRTRRVRNRGVHRKNTVSASDHIRLFLVFNGSVLRHVLGSFTTCMQTFVHAHLRHTHLCSSRQYALKVVYWSNLQVPPVFSFNLVWPSFISSR